MSQVAAVSQARAVVIDGGLFCFHLHAASGGEDFRAFQVAHTRSL
jgi:hypothetical protein